MVITQSAELHDLKLLFNMINIKLNRISRGHTLEVINANLNKDSVGQIHESNTNRTGEYLEKKSLSALNKNFSTYLAGLIEGDGAIYIPKCQGAAAIVIAFNGKYFALALLL